MISKQNKLFTVYMHIAPNTKVYIGITCRPVEKRWRNGEGYKCHPYFYNAIKEFGWENFEHKILFSDLTEKEAIKKEKALIKQYKSNQHDYGYNLTEGGEGGRLSAEAIEKMRKTKTGKKQSAESIEKRKKTFKKIGLNLGAKNGMYGKDPWNKGKTNIYTEAQLNDLRKKSLDGMYNSPKYKAYQQKWNLIKSEYAKNPKICPICGKPLPWKRHHLTTCGSDYCKIQIKKVKRK